MSRLPYSRSGRKERADGPGGRRILDNAALGSAALALLLISALLGALGWGLSGLG